jgi:hypothetical protein
METLYSSILFAFSLFNLISILLFHFMFYFVLHERVSWETISKHIVARSWCVVGKIKKSLIRILECWVWITSVIKEISHAVMRFLCENCYEPSCSIWCRETWTVCETLVSNWHLLETAQLLHFEFICFRCCLMSSFSSHLTTVAESVSEGFCFNNRNKARQAM